MIDEWQKYRIEREKPDGIHGLFVCLYVLAMLSCPAGMFIGWILTRVLS